MGGNVHPPVRLTDDGEKADMKQFGVFLIVVAILALFSPEIMGIFGGLLGGIIGLAAGLFAGVVGAAAGLFAGAVGIVAGLFGALVGIGTVLLVLALPVIIIVLIIMGVVHFFAA